MAACSWSEVGDSSSSVESDELPNYAPNDLGGVEKRAVQNLSPWLERFAVY